MPSLTKPTLLVTLAPSVESPRRARRALLEGGLDPDLDHVVSLLATELVSNSVLHVGAGAITLEASLREGFARVEVRDSGLGFDPEVRHETPGFGLRLVDKLASSWGVERERAGTTVWFMVDRRRRRFERD